MNFKFCFAFVVMEILHLKKDVVMSFSIGTMRVNASEGNRMEGEGTPGDCKSYTVSVRVGHRNCRPKTLSNCYNDLFTDHILG